MSSTRRGAERRTDDAYETPAWCVRRLLDAWRPRKAAWCVEPAVGRGAIIRAVERICPDERRGWISYDVRKVPPVPEGWFTRADFLSIKVVGNEDVGAVITNPPFSLAEEFLRHSRGLYPRAEIVFLLRLNFLAGNDRRSLWRDLGTPDVYVLPNRPDFTGGGGDSCEYAWFVLPAKPREKGHLRVLATTPLDERRLSE